MTTSTDEILQSESSDYVKFIVNVNYTCPCAVYHTRWFSKWRSPWNYEVGSADGGDDGDCYVDFEHPDSDGSFDFHFHVRMNTNTWDNTFLWQLKISWNFHRLCLLILYALTKCVYKKHHTYQNTVFFFKRSYFILLKMYVYVLKF